MCDATCQLVVNTSEGIIGMGNKMGEGWLLTAEMLENGNRLMDMNISKGTLVMLVKRGSEFMIPNGRMELKVGDKLLYISENKKEE